MLLPFITGAQTHVSQLPGLLAKRKAQQEAANRNMKAYREFQFVDRFSQSGITFEQQIVDDAAMTYKAVHYDHGTGMPIADVDGDGLLDVYFLTQLGQNELWRNLGNGKFENITARSGTGLTDIISVGGAFADLDNDGDPDLVVTTVRKGTFMLENIGKGRFQDISKKAGVAYVGHSAAPVIFDYDNDGQLDLLICNVGVFTTDEIGRGGFFVAMPSAFRGHQFPERTEMSILYKNKGGLKFEDVSKATGFQDKGWSGEASVCDLNNDGLMDVYMLNMQGDDHFYLNQGGKKFVEATQTYFPKTPWGSMGLKFFDYDGDSHLDLFITDMHSDMTSKQILESGNFSLSLEKEKSDQFCLSVWDETQLQGSSNNIFGNALFKNTGKPPFRDASQQAGVETYWPWGPSVGDLNADGYEDIVVTAGMNYPLRYAINSVLINEGGTKFFDAEFQLGVEPRPGNRFEKDWFTIDCNKNPNHPECANKKGVITVRGAVGTRSSAILDIDNDGDHDILTNEFNDRPQVLMSDLAGRKKLNWIKLQLVGASSNRDAIGAKVTVKTKSKSMTQQVDGKTGYLSQSSVPLYFGLGDDLEIQSINIQWPGSKPQTVTTNLAANRLIQITQTP